MSHRHVFEEHCRRHELAYPVDGSGTPFWRPSARAADWRVSAGLGTVYATTVVRGKEADPHNVCLVELDEGVRLMSRVEGVPAQDVTIGMRVALAWTPDDPPVPIFRPAAAQ